MRSTCPCFARVLIASCRVFQVSPPPGTGTTAVFTFPPGFVAAGASAALAAIAQQNTTQTAKTNHALRLPKQLHSWTNRPEQPKSTVLIGNCFRVEFIPGDFAPAQVEFKRGFRLFGAGRQNEDEEGRLQ